jgi:hypothetical protein
MATIAYRFGNDLDLDQVIELHRASTLGVRRPVDNRTTMEQMINHANLVVTAWDGTLNGRYRAHTDRLQLCWLPCRLAMRVSHQQCGVGRELIRQTRSRMGPSSLLVLLAAPKATGYYAKIGFTQHDSAWTLHATAPLTKSA